MQQNPSCREVDGKTVSTENVPAKEYVVRFGEGREARNVKFYVHPRKEESNGEQAYFYRFPPGFMDLSRADWFRTEPLPESRADACSVGAGIDLSEHEAGFFGSPQGADTNLDGRPILEQVIDRLLKADLGAKGFFVICHAN